MGKGELPTKENFSDYVSYGTGSHTNELVRVYAKGRAKKGMFEGDLENGELEIGQIAGLIHQIKPAGEILNEIILEYNEVKQSFC